MSLILYTDYVNTPQSESIILMQIRSKGINSVQSSAMPISDINLSYGSLIKCFGKFTSHCPFPLNYQCYFGCDALIFLIWILLRVYMSIFMHNHNVIVYALHKYIDCYAFCCFCLLSKMNKYNCLLDHKVVILQIWNCYSEAIASFAIVRTLSS